jgi:formylglycine-generating enzyme required for sulfatase activity
MNLRDAPEDAAVATTPELDEVILAIEHWVSRPQRNIDFQSYQETWLGTPVLLRYLSGRCPEASQSERLHQAVHNACEYLGNAPSDKVNYRCRLFGVSEGWKETWALARALCHISRAVIGQGGNVPGLYAWLKKSRPDDFTAAFADLQVVFESYHAAWSLPGEPVTVQDRDRVATRSNDAATAILDEFQPELIAHRNRNWFKRPNWLIVRRLLSYLLTPNSLPGPLGKTNRMHLLAAAPTDAEGAEEGRVLTATTQALVEGQKAIYLDPVTCGLMTIDDDLRSCLAISDQIISSELKHLDDTERTGLRISWDESTVLPHQLTGDSGGGLLVVSAVATSRGNGLDAGATASFAIHLKSSTGQTTKPRLEDYCIAPVGGIRAKLTNNPQLTTNDIRIQRVYLCAGQTLDPSGTAWDDWIPTVAGETGLTILPVGSGETQSDDIRTTLAQLIHDMTGDERIERVLTDHANTVFAEWEQIKNATKYSPHSLWKEQDEHRLDHYVWPNYRIELPETEDQRSKRMQEHKEPPAEPVLGEDTERERELLRRLIRGPKLLVVYDNAGAGKTVFSWRIRTDAASVEMRRELFEGHAPLVVRCDGKWQREKSKELLGLRERLTQELVATLESPPENPDKIVEYALKHRRVIVIVDGFDQFDSKERQHVVDLLLKDKTARDKCYWIITSRVHTIDALRNTLFIDRDWDRVRIDPFDERQQNLYFEDKGNSWLQTVPNRKAKAELLQLPMVLRLIRRSIEETPTGQSPPVFHTLSELFVTCARRLLDRAIRTSKEKISKAGLDNKDLPLGKQMELLERTLATLAFQMMVDQNYNALLDDAPDHSIEAFQENAEERFCFEQNQRRLVAIGLSGSRQNNAQLALDERQALWREALNVLKEIELNHRSVTEAYCPERIAFRSRKMMECYAALYLVKYANEGDRTAILPLLGDPQWDACWGLAIQMPRAEVVPSVVESTFALLFEAPADHPRPTEHMFHAWQLMKRDPQRYPGLEATLRSYRQQFLDILFGGDEDRAERAAEVITPEDFEKYLKSLSAASCSPLPSGEGPGVRAAPPSSSIPNPAWLQRVRQMYAERPTYAVCSDAKKPEEFRRAADPETRERQYTDPDHLTFLMGASPDDTSAYDVEKYDDSDPEQWWKELRIAAFQMATCCVTRAQYRLFDPHREQDQLLGDYGINERSPDEDCPVTYVDWWDAFCFALWVGEGYQLPTEVQWEGAAWGGIDRGKHKDWVVSVPPHQKGITTDQVNYNGKETWNDEKPQHTPADRTLPVRWDLDRLRRGLQHPAPKTPSAYEANGFGLWQVNGNVYEWCESGWAGTLSGAIERDSQDVAGEEVNSGTGRVVRGGSWSNSAWNTRASDRSWGGAENRGDFVGFRLSRIF